MRKAPLIFVQARMASQRLPGKVLADICGRPLLAWLLERVRPSQISGPIIVTTTTDPTDDTVVRLCDELGVTTFRGHPTDVLQRFADAAEAFDAETLVRLSADSPLLHYEIIDAVVSRFVREEAELVENHTPPGWPIGTAVEAMTASCLRRLDRMGRRSRHREHVTSFAYENPDQFAICSVPPAQRLTAPNLRLCVDTKEDLARIRAICEEFGPRRDFTMEEILDRLRGAAQHE